MPIYAKISESIRNRCRSGPSTSSL